MHLAIPSQACSRFTHRSAGCASARTLCAQPRASNSGLRRSARQVPLPGKLVRSTGSNGVLQVRSAAAEAVKVYEKEHKLGKSHKLKVLVDLDDSGSQRIMVQSDHPGKLLLHWGVEGGANYKGGWRLPGEAARPDGTVQYKARALQTPFKSGGGGQQVELLLSGDEASDYINFVVKDSSSGTWYDREGTNYHIPLTGSVATMSIDEQIPDAELPDLPGELCGIWSYIKWEQAGCPNRTEQESQAAYREAIKELKDFQRDGHSLEDLWNVAKGGIKYQDFVKGSIPKKQESQPAPAASVPEELVGLQAYLMWEKAGKPDGANFSDDARRQLEQQLQSGKSVQDLERALKGPSDQAQQQGQQPAQGNKQNGHTPQQKAEPKIKHKSEPAARKEEVHVGSSIGMSGRNPLDLIKTDAPLLSEATTSKAKRALAPLLDAAGRDEACVWYRSFNLGNKSELLVTVHQPEGQTGASTITLMTDQPAGMVMHWGVKKHGKGDWSPPPKEIIPRGSEQATDIAWETPLEAADSIQMQGDTLQLQKAVISVPAGLDLTGLTFVCKSKDGTMWWRDGGGNFNCPIPGPKSAAPEDDVLAEFEDELSRTIVDCEVNSSAWTLMHRYNKATELLDSVLNGSPDEVEDAMACIFVWLRYSSARHLTWQRNYNTQPRILGEAQAKLTHKIAEAHGRTGGTAQEWVRNMLGCVGRGGNAQAIRDEILHIMHRHHIGEKRGTWMEDWHQKLHNNTTPDDIVICEAYIIFLENNGDNGAYWRHLTDNGITRERLEGFDRAIKVEPENYPDKKDALIGEFRNYLKILRAVHSGADLQSSAEAAGGNLPGNAKGFLGYVLSHQFDNQILPLIENAVEARTELQQASKGNRELLYLDLALENTVRAAAERGSGASGTGAAALMAPLLQNLVLSAGDNEELAYCLKAWQALPDTVKTGRYPAKDDALKATAVIERIRRAISETSDAVNARLQPISSAFGKAFKVDDWAVELFAEEVVRGGPAFAVSLILSAMEPGFRAAAELGAWQLISPVNVTGKVVVVANLYEVQDKVYEEPTVLVAKRVTGEEEVPEGAVAVLTPDAPDVLSHVSVRARNMKVLFAICHEEGTLKEVEDKEGTTISLQTTAAGGVSWEVVEEQAAQSGPKEKKKKKQMTVKVPKWCGKWVVGMDDFKEGVVGAKSKNIAGLRGKLPKEINLPASVTVPFGSFEELLNQAANKQIKKELEAAIKNIPLEKAEEALSKCRDLVMQVKVPEQLKDDLASQMKEAGIPVPDSDERWGMALDALKGVWASKYNERAFLSMKKVGLNFLDLRMAVLVQRVVPAAYAFVIHTENPTNGAKDEIFAELVAGLGESIVSGMVPGSSLSFYAKKDALEKPEILMFPSKSDGMFVPESLIFRSDSNGEDLEGYAGAGLYDSITMDQTKLKKVDYNGDRLMTDSAFCLDLMSRVCKAGFAIEDALGSAQDVEGAVEEDGAITVVQTRPQM